VTRFSRLHKIVIDVPASDHEREVSFWEAALDQPLPPFGFPEYHGAALHGHDFWLLAQRLGEEPPACTWISTPMTWTPRWPGWSAWAPAACSACMPGR